MHTTRNDRLRMAGMALGVLLAVGAANAGHEEWNVKNRKRGQR